MTIYAAPNPLSAVTDAIAATNTLVLGLSPAHAAHLTMTHAALASGLALLNAVHGQHQQQAINTAACVRGVLALYGRGRR